MNVPLLQMPAHDAQVAFEEYRAAVKARHSEEDEAIMRGYKAMAEGKPVVDVSEAIKAAGLDEVGRPRLAICRADGHYCWYSAGLHTGAVFAMEERYNDRAHTRYLQLPPRLFGPDSELKGKLKYSRIRAIVPSIPPRLRPKAALSNYHILWEAEWETVPRDPYLLRHLYGYLYAVLAEWDLTELERAVLKGVRP